jgi:predicted glycosyltransferase
MRSLLFCNEMLGLGHLGLSLALAEALVATDEESTALVVTGSPAFAGMRVARRVDLLKLPTLPVDAQSQWSGTELRPLAHLALPSREVSALRSQISLATARGLRPQVVVVDYRPLGRNDELVPTLEWLKEQGECTVALGLWEVDDSADRLRSTWAADLLESVRDLYDLALVYGPSAPDDVRIDALRSVGVPVHHTDYVSAPRAARGPADIPGPYLLVSAGGGIDGFALLDAVIGAIRLRPLLIPAVLVTGPMMPADQVDRLRSAAAGLDVRVERFRADMAELLAGAQAVVSMAGYCTVAEVLASGTPALLVPRAFPREEQLNRARRLAAAGRVDMLDPRAAGPAELRHAIGRLLERSPLAQESPTGATDAAAILRRSLRKVT